MNSIGSPLPELLIRVGRKDQAAFRELYAALAPAMLATVRRQLPDHEAALAVVRATFIEVCLMCRRYGPSDDDVGGWIAGIAQRRAAERATTAERMAAERMAATERANAAGGELLAVLQADYDRTIELQLAALLGEPDRSHGAVESAA